MNTTPTDRALAQAFRELLAIAPFSIERNLRDIVDRAAEIDDAVTQAFHELPVGATWTKQSLERRAAEIDASKPEPAGPPLGDHTAVCPGCGLGFACGSKPITSESGPLIHQSACTPAPAEAVAALPGKWRTEAGPAEEIWRVLPEEQSGLHKLHECADEPEAALAARPAAVGGELPELPEAEYATWDDKSAGTIEVYSADQMRAYARQAITAFCEGLRDPATVHVNMLRGTIAKPTWRNIVDLMGEVPNSEERQLARIAELQHELAELRAAQPQQLAVTDEAVERLAKYIYAQEARKCSTLEAFNQHMRNWPRALPEARAMLNAALPHLARKENDPSRDTEIGWYWEATDMRVVMDCFGYPVIVPFCAEYGCDQLFEVL